MGGLTTDKDVPYTVQKLNDIVERAKNIKDDLDN